MPKIIGKYFKILNTFFFPCIISLTKYMDVSFCGGKYKRVSILNIEIDESNMEINKI